MRPSLPPLFITLAMLLSGHAGSATADTLSLQRYIQLAIEHSPQLRISDAAVKSSVAGVQSSRSRLLPHVGAGAGVNLSGDIGPGSTNTTVSTGVDVQQQLFDFGKSPLQVKAARKSLEASGHDQQAAIQSTVFNATRAYYNYLLSRQILSVNEEALRQAMSHQEQARILYEIGKQAQYSIIKANVDVANSQVRVIQARNSLKLAMVALETAAGVRFEAPLTLSDTLSGVEDSIGIDQALETALRRRPEILAAQAQSEAARLQLSAAQRSFLPSASASAGIDWRRTEFEGTPQPGWSVGASVNWPLFEGGATQAAVGQAAATAQRTAASVDLIIQNITQEVQQASLQELDARERIAATNVAVEQAAEGLRLSQERYRAGAATSIEITDAELALANANIAYSQALFDYHVAHAQLRLAMGVLQP